MLYHVVRRPPHNYTNSTKTLQNDHRIAVGSKLMPRYHYSRIAPTSATNSDSIFPRQHLGAHSAKPLMTATMTTTSYANPTNPSNHNNIYSYGSFKSNFIPLVTNNRPTITAKREPIPIPITREDGTTSDENPIRTVPITFINTASALTTNPATIGTNNSKTQYTSFFRPPSRQSQTNIHKNDENLSGLTLSTAIPRLPLVSRGVSLTIPTLTNSSTAMPIVPNTDIDDDQSQTSQMNLSISQSNRPIPVRFPQGANSSAPLSINNNRTSSAILRPAPKLTLINNHLQRQKTDLNDTSTSIEVTSPPTPGRRAEAIGRETMQGIARYQEQQNGNQNSTFENNPILNSTRSPALSRRYIINLKNNQSISLDSRLLSTNNSSNKQPNNPSSGRPIQRHGIYPLAVSHDIQMPSHPVTLAAENSPSMVPVDSSTTIRGQFKNEFRLEIPVTLVNSNEQENSMQDDNERHKEEQDDEHSLMMNNERFILTTPPTNSNPTLKSILKRSSSRDTVSRKNVSFMNA